jgi:hypothetical protein
MKPLKVKQLLGWRDFYLNLDSRCTVNDILGR